MAALVGADRQRPRHVGERLVGAGGERLLDHLDAEAEQRRGERRVFVGAPALVGVDDDPRPRRAGADGLEPGHVAFAAELDLEERAVGVPRRRRAHRLGSGEREGEGGDLGAGGGEAGQLPDAGAGALRREIPERAVDGVAGGAGREQVLELGAGRSVRGRPAISAATDVEALAVAGVGHAFAAAGVAAVARR